MLKNYKDLCEILNLPVKTGEAKTIQLNNLQRLFSYEKNKQKFIITEIFQNPKEKTDHRKEGNRSIYKPLIESILLQTFIDRNMPSIEFSKVELWETLGLINHKYREHNGHSLANRTSDLSRDLKLPDMMQWHMKEFDYLVYRKLNEIVRSSLNSLKKRKIITYQDDVIRVLKDNEWHIISDDEEIEAVLEIEKDVLLELNCNSINEVFFSRNPKKVNPDIFYNLRDTRLYEAYGYYYMHRAYRIMCCRTYLKLGKQENTEELKDRLNSRIVELLNKAVQKRWKENYQAWNNGETTFLYPSNYTDVLRFLIAKLIDRNQNAVDDIREEMWKVRHTFPTS